jgi:hypothetical protein
MSITESILQAAQAALAAPVLFYLPGAAWAWRLKPANALESCAASLAIGLPIILLPAIVLAECGVFSVQLVFIWAAVAAAYGLRRGGPEVTRPALPGFLVLAATAFALFLFPSRGEWIIGGWDPGVNMNQGLLLARTGGIPQAPEPIWAEAMRATPDAFSRAAFGFREAYPGVPIDPADGRIRPYFYRATPTLIALLEKVAGRAVAFEVNMTVALFAAALLAGALRAAGLASLWSLAGAFLLAAQPIVIAHYGDPASEMLELSLVCAAGFLLARPRDCPTALALGAVLLLGALNRISFLFALSLLLPVCAVWESTDKDHASAATRHLAIAAALALGLGWYAWVAPESAVKVRHLIPTLHLSAAAAVSGTLLLDGALLLYRAPAPAWVRALVILIPAALLAREGLRHDAWSEWARNAPAWLAYARPVAALLALPGLILALRRRAFAPWTLWLAFFLLAALLRRHAAELYPWAAKRWLSASPPLLAIGISLLADRIDAARDWRRRLFAAAVPVVALVAMAPLSLAAWRSAEHVGADSALTRIAALMGTNDIVVADHFRWATPLALAYGFTALNAEPLLAGRGDPAAAARFLEKAERRVVLLCSTRRGLDAWPPPFRDAAPLAEPILVETRERIHHRSHRAFGTRPRAYRLQAFEWKPAP